MGIEAYDIGLADGIAQGRAEKQDEIIKLLKDSDSVCNEWAIALIKGENK